MISCVGDSIKEKWMQRCPEIACLWLSCNEPPYECVDSQGWINARRSDGVLLYAEDVAAEVRSWRHSLDLARVDVLYVFGIALGAYYQELKSWLKQVPERMVIFLEDDPGVIKTVSELASSEELVLDPQVHLELIGEGKQLLAQLKMLTRTYPGQRIEVTALALYAQQRAQLFKKIRLTLLRESSVCDATLTDALYSHHLVENVLANVKRWPHSFLGNGLKNKFKNIPAVICGAGPSLDQSIPLLQTLQDKALIIAGGSTITALSHYGIVPHLGLAFDPNPEEYSRLRVSSAFEMPLLYGTRLQSDTFQTCNGPFGYLQSQTGGPCEAYFEQQLGIDAEPIGPDLGPEAFSVTTLAVAMAVEMGCNPIILNGVDLAYTRMQRYAEGVMPSSEVFLSDMLQEKRALETLLRRKSVAGKQVYTLVKWVMESNCISQYAKAHPDTQLINVSEQGLGFKGIPNLTLAQAVAQYCHTAYDLRSWVHAQIQPLDLKQITTEQVHATFKELELSLQALCEIADGMIAELTHLLQSEDLMQRVFPTGMMTLLQLNCEEEKAFSCFLPHVGPAIDQVLNRTHPLPLEKDSCAYRTQCLQRLIVKWQRLRMMILQEKHSLTHS